MSILNFKFYKEVKIQKTSWWDSKYFHLKPRRNFVIVAINQGVKFVNITKTYQSESSSTKRIHYITPQILNCASKNVVYLFTCKTCHKQYTGSTEEFHRSFLRNKNVKQESFTLISRNFFTKEKVIGKLDY